MSESSSLSTFASQHERPNFAIFERHRPTLRRLYLEDKKSLVKVKDEMEKQFGFPKTRLKFYEYGMQHLGFTKKLSSHIWAKIEDEARRRRVQEGKATDVYVSGIKHEWDRIIRRIWRKDKKATSRASRAKQSIIELPESVSLRTPPLIIGTPLLLSPTVHRGPDKLSLSSLAPGQYESQDMRSLMFSYPDSTILLLGDVPSSRLITILQQMTGISPQGLWSTGPTNFVTYSHTTPPPVCHTLPTWDVDYSSNNGTVRLHPSSSTQLNLLEALICISTRLANNCHIEDVVDVCTLFEWVGADANKSTLKAFFSHDDSAVAAVWRALITLLRHDKMAGARKAFQNLVEIAFETHDGQWIREQHLTLVRLLAQIGSPIRHHISKRLLSSDLIRSTPEIIMDDRADDDSNEREYGGMNNLLLYDIARNLDDEMMEIFLDAGIFFREDTHKNLKRRKGTLFELDHRYDGEISNTNHYIGLLVKAQFDIDHMSDGTFFGLRHTNRRDGRETFEQVKYIFNALDLLWIEGQLGVYDAAVPYSDRARTKITIPGLLGAACKGIGPLKKYLDSKQDDVRDGGRRSMLEFALFVAAEQGNSTAIRSLVQAGVHPNIFSLPFTTHKGPLKVKCHPLMHAARGKHLDAFHTLIELGVNPLFENHYPNYLSAAIWSLLPLSDSERQEQREFVRYLFNNDFIDDKHIDDAIIEAMAPIGWTGNLTRDDYMLDEYTFDTLLKLKNGLHPELDGRNLIHIAIGKGYNLQTVEFLHSRGVQVHSHPDKNGRTMVHSAAASRSKDRLKIVKFLLEKGASCTAEWSGLTILESAFCAERGFDPEWEKRRDAHLELFSFLWKKGALIDYPGRSQKSWANVLVSLLQCEASDELIYEAIRSGADIHSPGRLDENGPSYTPLQFAAHGGRLAVARRLLAKGADVNEPVARSFGWDEEGTALECAIKSNSEALILLMLKTGANFHAVTPNGNALHVSIKCGLMGVFCYLQDLGADCNAEVPATPHSLGSRPSFDKWRALDKAAYHGRLDMVDILVKRGGESAKQVDSPYDGAIELANWYRHFEISKLLREKAAELARMAVPPVAGQAFPRVVELGV